MKLKPPKESTLPAKDMDMSQVYMTAKSEWPRQTPCQLIKVDYAKKQVLLRAYQPNTQEWRDVWVDMDYPVRKQKGEEIMKIKKATEKASANPKAVSKTKGTTTGVGVFETWAIAFQKFGSSPDAVVSFMKKEYPNRKTDWAKWVNGMRQRYNRGALTKTVPANQIAPYVAKAKPSMIVKKKKK